MYELNEAVSSLANLAFGLIGIWMAHSLYRSPRKRWQTVLTWVLTFAVWTVGAPLLQLLFPEAAYVRLSMCVGFTGILAYLFLFPNIPAGQRVFTYFMVDSSMTLLVLLARTLAVLAEQTLGISGDLAFFVIYVPLTVSFLVAFCRWLRDYILSALAVFRAHLVSLAVFTAVGYVALLLQIDTWGPWPALDFWSAGGRFGMIALIVAGYVLAFRTLTTIRRQDAAEESARYLAQQVALSERYYDSLVEQIEQTRMRDHDLRHHINTLAGLCAREDAQVIKNYVNCMVAELPPGRAARYCEEPALNALLDHYAALCGKEDVAFSAQVHLAAGSGVEPLHLCVIFGNALQNALEASLRLPTSAKRFIDLKVAPDGARLAISISNRYDGRLLSDGEGRLSSVKDEPGHGLGLASITETARRYGGWCGTDWADEVFTLRVILNCGAVT